MATAPASARSRYGLAVAVLVATVLAVGLRTYGITTQIVIDDEWHAIHKLATSSYWDIFRTFGLADHSIPMTLLYKAMADTVGLAEGRLRAPQILCGIALVPTCAWFAWRATRDAPAAALLALLVSASPFLVMYSRYARPYAIELLLVVLFIGGLWRWRTRRSLRLGAWLAAAAAVAAWFHPLCLMYAAIGCLFVLFQDVAAPADVRPRPSSRSFVLGLGVLGATLLLLAAPLIHDVRSLTGKRGSDQPDLATYDRMLAIFWGGPPAPYVMLACGLAAWGLVVMLRRDRPLGLYLGLLATLPAAIVTLVGAQWAHGGQTLARYTLPSLPIVLFFGCIGAMSIVRTVVRPAKEAAAWSAAAVLSGAYLAATPAIAQVATLGPWYGHSEHHWDYRYRWMVAKSNNPAAQPPAFYHRLARMAPGSAGIVEAPFIWEAPYELFGYYATFHRQREWMGMLYDVCLVGDRVGEVPHDRRFRFRRFVYLDDVRSVRATGARYLLLHRREPQHVGPHYDNRRCVEKLTPLYGAPVEIDERLAVFDLRPGEPQPTLQ